MSGSANSEEIRSVLAPLFDMEWPIEESKAHRAKELFGRYFNLALDDMFKDREESGYRHDEFLIKQVASQMERVLSTLKIKTGTTGGASKNEDQNDT